MLHFTQLMEKPKFLTDLQQHNIPESLKFWTSAINRQTTLSYDQVARQIFDLYSLPGETWALFQGLDGQVSPSLDRFINEAGAFRELDSKEKVSRYFEAELLKKQDPYFMMGKIGMPGSGIRAFYDRLLKISGLEDLAPEERKNVLEMLGHWEKAALEVICEPDLYFTKTATGNEGTISEFFGSSIVFDVDIQKSPNMQDGRYKDRLMTAVDYEGIVNGSYKRTDYDQFSRQERLLLLLYGSQGTNNKLDQDFWRAIEDNEDFILTSHEIAVKEGYPQANDLLVRAIDYTWRKSEEGVLLYDWVSDQILEDHFGGKTAAEKFLTDPEMRFEEKFHGSRSNVSDDYLWDHQRITESDRDMMILLDCSRDGDSVTARYAHVGQTYSEGTATINTRSSTVTGLEGDLAITLLKMVDEFETFKQTYLQKLSKS